MNTDLSVTGKMLQKTLPFCAKTLLSRLHFLDNPMLISLSERHFSAPDLSKQDPCTTQSERTGLNQLLIGFNPSQQLQAFNQDQLRELQNQLAQSPSPFIHINEADTEGAQHTKQPPEQQPANPPGSGWYGYFAYQAKTGMPLAEFHYYPLLLLIDQQSNQCQLLYRQHNSEEEINNLCQQIEAVISAPLQADISSADAESHSQLRQWQPGWTKIQYQQAFDRVQDYLHAGDCYQTNLTMPFYCQDDLTQQNPIELINHFNAPFSVYFKTRHLSLFSVSPERFISIKGTHIETKPIKGTSPRASEPEQDQHNADSLLNSDKDRAENLMIVDLLRNDLSVSAIPHSVKVEKLFALESHANVHHLVSTISAQRKAGINNVDVILNAFPGGSITGAPKKRAMEIIEELELAPRGLYCGSFGYFADNGDADFNILIRSITATPIGAECWGGGGITVGSTCDDEYQEILNKVSRIMATPL